jgi:methyl-accepting chemotaxis protein
MGNVPIIGKLLAVMAIFCVFVIGSTVYAASQMDALQSGFTNITNGQIAARRYVLLADISLVSVRKDIGQMLIETTASDSLASQNAITSDQADFDNFITNAANLSPEHAADLLSLKSKVDDVLNGTCSQTVSQAAFATTQAQDDAAQAQYLSTCSRAFSPLQQDMTALQKSLGDDADQANAGLAQSAASTVFITYCIVLAGLAVVLVAGFFAIRAWIVKPMTGLQATMERLAIGDYQAKVLGGQRRDEIGGMARAVDIFKAAGIEKLRLEREAEAAREKAAEERARSDAEREAAEKQQAFVVESVAEGLEKLSNGDLIFRLSTPFSVSYEKLRNDFNLAMDKLQETMKAISHNTEGVRSGAGEITQASDDLSHRTEQQAASLEETAAALDEITATIRRTAEGAKEARNIVATAKADAEKSGDVVRDTVEAMGGIEKSSKQIGNIIGVIDEIAFQTNLLALNAGVEAARAGDAGRGFAVVATEVRALAQRSADAAKEIKALISTSGQQVDTGVRLVAETGKALARIVEQVAKLNGVVTEIAASAQEQATGLNEVNMAVNQMDQVTQQNAAMVEQATAASHSLANEAEALANLVGEFQIGKTTDPLSERQMAGKIVSLKEPSNATAIAQQPPARRSTAARAGNRFTSTAALKNQTWDEF